MMSAKGYYSIYEWNQQTIDEFGDIEANSFSDDLSVYDNTDLENMELIKRVGHDDYGNDYSTYAIIIDGELETEFCNGDKVPQKYLKQFNKFKNK